MLYYIYYVLYQMLYHIQLIHITQPRVICLQITRNIVELENSCGTHVSVFTAEKL